MSVVALPARSSGRRSLHLHLSSPPVWVASCVALAVASWPLLPTVPSYDPWSWIVWGREVSDPHLPFAIGGGPSWKPLPFLFTTVFGLFGAAAPTLWVIAARAGGLLGLVGAVRLTARLEGTRGWGAVAGAIAVAGIVLTQDWGYDMLRGASEPGLIACTVWGADRWLERRHVSAFALLVAAALIRPECWPFLGLYAVWLWWRAPVFATGPARAALLAGLVLVPLLWFGPPWIGSGHPLLAAAHAHEYDGHLGRDPLRAVIVRGLDLQPSPALLGAVLAVLGGVARDPSRVRAGHGARVVDERSRALAALGLGVIAWWVVVVAMTLGGYPGLERFFLPAAALICVLGGVGLVELARAVGRRVGERVGVSRGAARRGAPECHRWAAALALVVSLGAAAPLVSGRASALGAELPAARHARSLIRELRVTVAAAGGRRAAYPCASSVVAVNHSVATALAWILHVPLGRVNGVMSHPGLDFVGPHVAATGEAAPLDPRLTASAPVLRRGPWRVVQRTDPRHPRLDRCVGR